MTDPDQIAEAISRDSRFAILQQAIAVEADMRDNATIKALIAAIRADMDLAVVELAETSPHDTKEVSLLLVRVRAYIQLKRMIENILTRGKNAEAEIRQQDADFTDHE